MEHFYQTIPGWFSYDYMYKDAVARAEGGELFVEIGSYKGQSTAFMCVEIANSGKNIKFECVDPMKLMGHYENIPADEKEGYSAEDFHKRLESVKDYYTLHEMTSDDAVSLFEDGSIDFLLIDGDHSYEAVKKDITNYLPKMKKGGVIVGDDAWSPDVQNALRDAVVGTGQEAQMANGIHFWIEIV